MDCLSSGTDTQQEVRKLQDLVKKLERQNQQLRSRQNMENRQRDSRETTPTSNTKLNSDRRKGVSTINSNVMDEDDLIDIEQLDLSNEDSWLYESPQSLTPEQKALSPYKWLRTDVEDNQNTDIQAVKRALVRKIEELSRTPNPFASARNASRRSQVLAENAVVQNSKPVVAGPRLLHNPKEVDTRTFTRPKKKHSFELPVVDSEVVARDDGIHKAVLNPAMSDVVDIHTLVRLQEESLRQSSPPSTPRRDSGSSSACPRSVTSSVIPDDCDGPNNSLGNLTFTISGQDSVSEGSSKTMSSRASSTSASPAASPHGSQYFDDGCTSAQDGKGLRHRKSRPLNGVIAYRSNSRGAHQALPSRLAENCVDGTVTDHLTRHPGHTTSRLQPPGGRNVHSPSMQRRAQIEPLVTEAESTKVNQHSRIPKPRTRSSIPIYSKIRTARDDSWKEGCF